MFRQIDPEIQRRWQEYVGRAQMPKRVQEIHEHYRKTGVFRPEDLRRVLGDPNQSVEIGPNSTLASAMAQRTAHYCQ